MGKIPRVMVFGNSVALAGIAASLGLDPECEIVGHAWPIDREELCTLDQITKIRQKRAPAVFRQAPKEGTSGSR